MGKAKRIAEFVNDKRLSHVPGPSTYSIPAKDKTKQPTWSSGKEKRFVERKSGNPGPGNYEHRQHTTDGSKYSLRVKPAMNPRKNLTNTGPGDYDPRPLASNNIAYSISKRHSTPQKNSPGPGAYDDGRALYYQTMKGSKIGKEVRKGDFLRTASYQKQEPGKYDLKGFAGDFYNGSPNTVFSSDAKSKTFK